MDLAAHEIAERLVDGTMPLDGALSGESGGHDAHPVMPAARGPGMAGVQSNCRR